MLVRHTLPADLLTPLAGYLALRAAGACVLLESSNREGPAGDSVGRYSFVLIGGDEPREVKLAPPALGWVEAIRDLAGPHVHAWTDDPESELPDSGMFPMGVGCSGYVGFESVGALERSIPLPARDTLGLPGVWIRSFHAALVFDHLHQIAQLQVHLPDGAPLEAGLRRIRALLDALEARKLPKTTRHPQARARPLIDRATYEGYVRRAQALIHDGDVYQLVPSQRFVIDAPPPPLEAYRNLRRLNPSPYSILLEWEGMALVGASPESLVRVQGDGEAETTPIAGTIPRGRSLEEDAERFAQLVRDPKELAEHQMLVDLARNDLGRVALPGAVRVESPLTIQRTSHVLHIVSTVLAKLKPGVDALDVLASTFPAGTVSGAPKIRACLRIAEMEQEVRGPYGGALLRLGADGRLDTALILRTAVYAGGKAYVQAGAGVVRRSNPSQEYEETLHKAGATIEALGATLDVDPDVRGERS